MIRIRNIGTCTAYRGKFTGTFQEEVLVLAAKLEEPLESRQSAFVILSGVENLTKQTVGVLTCTLDGEELPEVLASFGKFVDLEIMASDDEPFLLTL
jgi:hypothetical protein